MKDRIGSSLGLKILQDHIIEGDILPGSYSVFGPDVIMGHDVTAPPAIGMLNNAGIPHLRASSRVFLYEDHFTPPKDRASAEACRSMREFSGRFGIGELVRWGEGICHVHLFDEDRIGPGNMVVGADSHTTTGGALGAFSCGIGSTDLAVAIASGEIWLEVPEPLGVIFEGIPDVWCEGKDLALRLASWLGPGGGRGRGLEMDGDIIQWLGMDGRMTISNMAAETSCTAALITSETKEFGPMAPDWNWETEKVNVEEMGPQIAVPYSPNKVDEVDNMEGEIVDQVFVGSCTNGRLDDMRVLAGVLKGKKVHPDVNLLVIPGSKRIYGAAEKAGYLKTIVDAGGVVSMPTCGPCAGGFLGVLPDGEVSLATSNRNFRGRMGEPTSKVYLSGVAVAGASAIKGMITHPREVRT